MNDFLKRFCTNHWIGAITAIATIVSVPLSVFLYLKSVNQPKITWYKNPVVTPIFSAGVSSDISISYRDSEIEGPVNAIQIAIWNAGNAPVKQQDMLSPIRFTIGKNCRILEATIRSISRPITAVSVNKSESETGTIELDWKILEKEDGCTFQVIFEGPGDSAIQASGSVIGQREIFQIFRRFAI